MSLSARRLCVLLVLWLPTLALAEPWPGPNKVPSFLRPTMADFWRTLASHSEEQSEAMIRDAAPRLGFERSQYTAGDMACMFWFSAWAQTSSGARRMPELGIPQGFIDALEREYKEACKDDGPGGPGAPAGNKGWATVVRAITGRSSVQKEAFFRPLTAQEKEAVLSAAKWAAAGAAVLLSVPSLAFP